jgi:hypothetical protein
MLVRTQRHSGQAQREPESRLDSRPGFLAAGVTFFRGNDGPRHQSRQAAGHLRWLRTVSQSPAALVFLKIAG